MSRRRPWIAAGLAVLYPGAGHLYLRSWARALVWFGLAFLTATVVVPESVLQAGEEGGFGAFYNAFVALDPLTLLPLFVVTGLNAVDAFVTARRQNEARGYKFADAIGGKGQPTDGDGDLTCPNCGRELDEEIDFCPWCTTRLEGENEETTVR